MPISGNITSDYSILELAGVATLKGLAKEWQWAARKALKGVEQSLALFWGHQATIGVQETGVQEFRRTGALEC